ncbi:alpha/beta fold hydrolase [Paraburkholderia lycopersici]|uniref:Pimeloyl-ACP methyl ester carboxylesterase n=1 Tax=Paraburkholderia lycopersici TaxID=416944 RepID=A0A1G7C843_9BURK|nr:alpha/beta hydrolase [Paraburkholderia lycopersici]SDE35488.1 Pimeloyl-ACP methyl ester carboxylesterase [Paraburkholderia lycopersici]
MSRCPPVIFVHGFIGTLDVSAFEAAYAAPDLLGYGGHRSVPFDQISLPAQVEHIRAFIDAHIGATVVDLVGHSVGGAIAMLFAHAYPERVRRIVNVEGNFTLDDAFWSASVGRMTPGEADVMLESFRADPLRWLRGAIADATPDMEEVATRWLKHQPASTLRAMGRSVVEVTGSADYLAALNQVFQSRPVYLLSGERSRDGWNVPDWALRQCAGHEKLDRCGHLMMIESPRAFSASIQRFLSHPCTP